MEEMLKGKPIYKGLAGVLIDETKISSIDGKNGTLFYRGYPLKLLVEKVKFEEVIYLLIYGVLPNISQLEELNATLRKEREIPDNILVILKSFPRNTTRIELLRTAISALSLYDPDDRDYPEKQTAEDINIRKGLRIISKIPTILAYSHRIQANLPIIEPSQDLSHAANFYYMMTGHKPCSEIEDAFDKVLTIHAEHSLNASTFSARVTVSTLSDIYSAVVSAIGTLRGPLHGGANERAIKAFVEEIKTKNNVIPWAKAKLEKKEKIMGFGHRVYKVIDPRAKILREISKKFWGYTDSSELYCIKIEPHVSLGIQKDVDNIFEMTEILVKYVQEEKGLKPNVDLYSAGLLYAMGLPMQLYTPLFAAARSVGWVSHSIEQLKNNKLLRPRLRYIGEYNRKFVELNKR